MFFRKSAIYLFTLQSSWLFNNLWKPPYQISQATPWTRQEPRYTKLSGFLRHPIEASLIERRHLAISS